MNWRAFELKYNEKESWAFEQLSYLLFCSEFHNRVGLFRYKNQTGIETEPIENNGRFYGFQSKYYTTSIADNKCDIIDSIKKAKYKNNHLDELHIYINQELSESTDKNKKKPQYQIDIEESAIKVGLSIQWRVPSHFELQLYLPENKYIYDAFFSLDPNEEDLIDEVLKHNDNILQSIQTKITYGNKQIKIDRGSVIGSIVRAHRNNENIIISGEGGCGKTAILKELYNSYFNKVPICIFKANELNVNNINEIFQFDHAFSFAQFLNAYKDETNKIFVIDSAEKLAEIYNNDILGNLIQKLKDNGWIIFFTTRHAYLNDLTFHIKENYQLSFNVFDVSLLNIDELREISETFNFSLPNNPKFTNRLKNLFYLNEYLRNYKRIDRQGNFKEFIELLWKKRIQNNINQKDNIHLEREKTIINIAKRRCETGRFYVNGDDCSQSALFQLRQDEILGYDEAHNGYFITHDIYEEWTLNKIVTRNFVNYLSTKQFFQDLGNSLPIRRAFRLWLSDQLSDNRKEVISFIRDAFNCSEITQFWQDEILISILLSDYSEDFFNLFENEVTSNDFKILKRALFLLRIACTDVSTVESFEIIQPKGRGWKEVISLIYKRRTDFLEDNLKLVFPILIAWCDYTKHGITTRYAGLLALSLLWKTETNEDYFVHNEEEEDILKVIFNASNEIKVELTTIIEKVVANNWTQHRDPYVGFCLKILEKSYLATELIKTIPLSVIQLCDLFWQRQPKKHDRFRSNRYSMEKTYGLTSKSEINYSPSSANQTPIKLLLQVAFQETLDFIIDFTNKAIETYSQSKYGDEELVEIKLYIRGKKVTQYVSSPIWSMYRGNGTTSTPYLLESIHMALEKVLLHFAQLPESKKVIREILLKILVQAKSASLTSVVCSIVLANYDKYYDVALILFKTIELFELDTFRCISEIHSKTLYSIGYGLDKIKDLLYIDERLKTTEDKHRSSNLESLFLHYQFSGIKGFSENQNHEFIKKLYEIIDDHKSKSTTSKEYGILLARMDRRNLTLEKTHYNKDGLVFEFIPKELSEQHRAEIQQEMPKRQEFFKYSSLNTWSNFLFDEDSQNKIEKHDEYDNNPLLALSETKQIVEELQLERSEIRKMDYYIPALSCAKLMIRHKKELGTEDKEFCKEIILSTLSNLFSDDYTYQINDGVEAAVHAMPTLMCEYPEETEGYMTIMILALFDETPLGQYKRICDYVIESIHKSKLWEENQEAAQSILFAYIKLKPLYSKVLTKERDNLENFGRISKSSILEEFNKNSTDFNFEDISFELKDIDLLDISGLEIVHQLIPLDTKDEIHLSILEKTFPLLASELLGERQSYKYDSNLDSNIYSLRLNLFEWCAHFILQRDIREIDKFLTPFLNSISSTEQTALFIEKFISAENHLSSDKQFWYIWDRLYPKIKKLCINPNDYHLKEIIINYLLAWPWWNDDIEGWESLKRENLTLYNNASKEIGEIPAVLFSIVRVLNSIGANFKDEGIFWISTIVSTNSSLNLGELESNTLYYLEKLMRQYIYVNRKEIKKDVRLGNSIIPILDFMIDRGSIHGYLLRESVL